MLEQRRAEDLGTAVEALLVRSDPPQSRQHVGSLTTGWCFGHDLLEQCPGAIDLARVEAPCGGLHRRRRRPSAPAFAGVRRRASSNRSAAEPGAPRARARAGGLVERGCDGSVGAPAASAMCRPRSSGRRESRPGDHARLRLRAGDISAVRDGGEQRMGETHAPLVQLDDPALAAASSASVESPMTASTTPRSAVTGPLRSPSPRAPLEAGAQAIPHEVVQIGGDRDFFALVAESPSLEDRICDLECERRGCRPSAHEGARATARMDACIQPGED